MFFSQRVESLTILSMSAGVRIYLASTWSLVKVIKRSVKSLLSKRTFSNWTEKGKLFLFKKIKGFFIFIPDIGLAMEILIEISYEKHSLK
jgi:hypothetical protein